MHINEPTQTSPIKNFAVFNLGFRIFFLAAGIFSIISMALWAVLYQYPLTLEFNTFSSSQWHAHEMIYGYALAVIAGFLLTAVKNWTGQQTPQGVSLFIIFSLWLIARLLFLFGSTYMSFAAFFDISFLLSVTIAVAIPIFKVKQWKHLAILSQLILLLIFNVVFYLGVFGIIEQGVYLGTYAGILLVVGLILIMARRVVPFFIERGVDYQVTLFNSKIIDITTLILFLLFFISELFLTIPLLSLSLTIGLFLVNTIRLLGWHTKGIWGKSMLWSLYLGCWLVCIDFLLFAASYLFGISKYLAIHAFAVGGVGIITMGMMSRVALGHTGRDVNAPSKIIGYALSILVLATIVRILLPLIDSSLYNIWIGLSQLFWIISFLIFTIIYAPILIKPRIDGNPE